ncbi:MAG: hypothetical protein AAF690_27320 [Acidobacteriota bacterium]
MQETAPLTPTARLLQSFVVAGLATVMVLVSAALSSLLYDRLPAYIDVILVVFVFPFVAMIGVLLLDAKVITPLVPNWLRRHDGRAADLPSLIGGAILAAAIAAIYPGMFVGQTYASMLVEGTAMDVTAAEAPPRAGFYRFRDSSLRTDLAGQRARKVPVRTNNITRYETRITYAAPIVSDRWSSSEPVTVWAITDDETPPWQAGTVGPLRGVRLVDERGHRMRAVRSIAEEHGVRLEKGTVLLELSESYESVRSRSSRRTWLVLGPLCLLVFVFVARNASYVLGPRYGNWAQPSD